MSSFWERAGRCSHDPWWSMNIPHIQTAMLVHSCCRSWWRPRILAMNTLRRCRDTGVPGKILREAPWGCHKVKTWWHRHGIKPNTSNTGNLSKNCAEQWLLYPWPIFWDDEIQWIQPGSKENCWSGPLYPWKFDWPLILFTSIHIYSLCLTMLWIAMDRWSIQMVTNNSWLSIDTNHWH